MKRILYVVLSLTIVTVCYFGPLIAHANIKTLENAIQDGDIRAVKHFIGGDIAVDAKIDGWPLLAIAANYNRDDIVRLLLKHGAQIDAQNKKGDTALLLAAYNGYVNVVRILLSAGANVDITGFDGATSLMWASNKGYADVVKVILSHTANVDTPLNPHVNSPSIVGTRSGDTALMLAAKGGHYKIVQLLLQHGADVNATNIDCENAIMYSKRAEHNSIAVLLTQQGADPTAQSCNLKYFSIIAVALLFFIAWLAFIRLSGTPQKILISRVAIILNGLTGLLMIFLFVPAVFLYNITYEDIAIIILVAIPFLTISALGILDYKIYRWAILGINFFAALFLIASMLKFEAEEFAMIGFWVLLLIIIASINCWALYFMDNKSCKTDP